MREQIPGCSSTDSTAVNFFDVQHKILHATARLRDNAAVWWQHLNLQVANGHRAAIANWANFELAILAEFQPLDTAKTARDKLADLTQQKSVSSYVGRLRDLAIQIPDLSHGDLLHRFTRGLKPSIRKEVELRDPQTLDDAIRLAARADTI